MSMIRENEIYSRQLFRELADNLDKHISRFFMDTKQVFSYEVGTLNELIEYTLKEYLEENTSREAMTKIYDLTIRNRRRKKARMLAKLKEDLETTLRSTEHNQRSYHLMKNMHETTLQEAEKWSKNSESYFVSFWDSYGGIETQTANRIFHDIVSDTLLCILNYVKNNYEGAIDNYFLMVPQNLLGIPLFAPKKVRLELNLNEEHQIVDRHEYSAGVLETNTVLSNIEISQQLSVMDEKDLRFLYISLQNLDEDFITTRKARVKKSVLAKVLYERPGKKHYHAMLEHCHSLSKYNFCIFSPEGKKTMSFNLIDTVDSQDPEEVVFTYGNMLYQSVLANELTRVKSSHLELLELNLSSILYHSLFNERMVLSVKWKNEEALLAADYPFEFFTNNVRFPKQSKKKNLDLIQESLEEFLTKRIVVKSYERNTQGFRISFFPLTDEEREDLTFNK